VTIEFECDADGVALIRIARPHKLNAIDPATDDALRAAWARVERDDAVRCAILTGAGERAFCVGAEIGTMLPALREQAIANRDDGAFCGMTRVAPTRKPIIAAINGFAFGGGLEIALACDIRIASDSARFGLPEVQLGVLAGGGGVSRLPRFISPALACEMLLTGEPIDAQTALRAGLVSRLAPAPELIDTARRIASRIARNAPRSVERTLWLVRRSRGELPGALDLERESFRSLLASSDAHEGIAAFVAKREPVFRGR
jgi:enoyl-CoA hydratase/carnithine racemase